MKEVFHKLETIVDKSIPPALIVLLGILILEFFYSNEIEPYYLYIEIVDAIIILIFIVDLIFKYQRVRNTSKFIRKYWLEIIAVLPFFLVFRALEGFARISGLIEETTKEGQQVVHAGIEISREFSKAEKEAEAAAKLSRGERFTRFLRPIARSIRFLKVGKEPKKFVDKGTKEFSKFFNEPADFYKKEYKSLKKRIAFKPANLKNITFSPKI